MSDEGRIGRWFTMVTGQKFWIRDLRPGDFDPRVIACGLANAPRWGGQLTTFLPVAQHCVLVDDAVDAWYGTPVDAPDARHKRDIRLRALIHDAPEGLGLHDLPSPIKSEAMMDGYVACEAGVMDAICDWLDLPRDEPHIVRRADLAVRLAEARDLRPNCALRAEAVSAIPQKIVPWSTHEAEARWLARFNELTGGDRKPFSRRARWAAARLAAPTARLRHYLYLADAVLALDGHDDAVAELLRDDLDTRWHALSDAELAWFRDAELAIDPPAIAVSA